MRVRSKLTKNKPNANSFQAVRQPSFITSPPKWLFCSGVINQDLPITDLRLGDCNEMVYAARTSYEGCYSPLEKDTTRSLSPKYLNGFRPYPFLFKWSI